MEEDSEEEDESGEDAKENGDGAEWDELELAEREQADEPYKPIYQVTSALQRIGVSTEKEEKEEKVGVVAEEEEPPSTTFMITTSIDDKELSGVLDEMHAYLFHAVHEQRLIPL